ncbi:MAG: DUF2933 domain-containing protein [Rhodospirillaceae bacterium]|nr:DUF2933 domain-containing protein [Rhodospirillaceae bacterium]
MTMTPPPQRGGLGDWLLSRTGLATAVAVAILAFLIATGHRAHLLGALPYLLLLACPLMHLFMHGGHGGHGSHDDTQHDRQTRE